MTWVLFKWRWWTLGRWDNPPSRGRKIKCVYIQSYHPGVLGWGFLRLLLRLLLGSLSIGVPSSRLEKDERLILGHVCIYSWKRHELCYALLGYARNRCLNTLRNSLKYGRFTTRNIPKCEHFTLLVCPLRFLVISAMRRLGNVKSFITYVFRFWIFCHESDPGWAGYPTLRLLHGELSLRLTGLPYLTDRVTRPSGSPHLSCNHDQDKIRNYMSRWVTPPRRFTSPTWGPPPVNRPLEIQFSHTVLIKFSLSSLEKILWSVNMGWRGKKIKKVNIS